jgi:FAD/FMN-containing dehydrogenase
MPIQNVDLSPNQDEVFFSEFEQELPENRREPALVDPRIERTNQHDRIADVLVLNAQPISITNPSKTWKTRATRYCFPLHLEATVELVKLAEAENRKIRVIGQRHSFSQTCLTDGSLIDLSKAHPYNPKDHNNTVGKIDQSALLLLKDTEERENYFDVPGGMQIFMINKILCPEDDRLTARFGKRRLFNMGGGDVQSFAGAFATGTHGSGGIHSAYHDMVRSILLVAGEAKLYRIEPSNGITDANKHAQFYADNPALSKVELIQDDDKFYAALVSFGCFGVIYSAIIETKPMSFLHKEIVYQPGGLSAHTAKTTIDDIMSSLNDHDEIFHYLQFNPYPVGNNEHPSYLTKLLTLVDMQEDIVGKDNSVQKWPAAFTKLPWVGDVIRFLTNHRLSPPRRLVESVLRIQRRENGRQDLAYRIWNAGASGRLMTIGTAIEFAFPVSNAASIIKLIIEHLNQVGVKNLGYYVNGPISVRFVRASKAFMAPNYAKFKTKIHDWWCYIEIVRINSSDPDDDKKELELYKHLQMMLMLKGGRPHWGLNFQFPFTLDYLRSIYPEMDKWIEAKHFFDPKGTFESSFIQSWLR